MNSPDTTQSARAQCSPPAFLLENHRLMSPWANVPLFSVVLHALCWSIWPVFVSLQLFAEHWVWVCGG